MPGIFDRLSSLVSTPFRRRLCSLYGLLAVANIAAWIWAFAELGHQPVLLGTAFLAYTFGLRHAVDADHIAAIDNVTRKLMQQGQRPIGVGSFFSLGHAAVVVIMTLAVAFAAAEITSRFGAMKAVGSVISTLVSAGFLFLLAFVNIVVLKSVYRTFTAVRQGRPFVEDDFDMLLNGRGLLARLFRPVFAFVSKSWHMFPIGFLFGFGFDTATEVALFGISATQASDGLSLGTILVFPALFTVGMTLVDTTDGVLMLGAYGWAFDKPMRKLFYNMTITAVSVIVAVFVGGIETLGLISAKFELQGPFWQTVGAVNDNFGLLGYGIIGLFVLSWIVSFVIYRAGGYDRIEVAKA
ncbi:MAG: HoxN/HupN/NixA family nickel/cobalt transporter [Ancalomicrobiaceae bacterium]|nr:HoxN/HupN/NixA family nickel/cobalt transporter [Ancalomicrobiaceae bacterium]